MSRRKFFKLLGESVVRAAAEFTFEVSKPGKRFIRPPGSADEETFLALCKRCGECVKSCPTGVLDTVREMNPLILDTPFMNFENSYCEQCYACIDACTSGALSRENLKRFRYVAELDKKRCISFQNMLCQSCYWSCPEMDRAITLSDMNHPEFHPERCRGCGRCVNACPTNPKAIRLVKVKNEGD